MKPEDAGKSKPNHPDISPTEAKWWESAEDHKFALEVLQLRLRRNILKFLSQETRTMDEIEKEFSLNTERAKYHLAMLEKGLVIEHMGDSYRLTITGRLYLEKVQYRH
jgi:predicted transcriptional regulator